MWEGRLACKKIKRRVQRREIGSDMNMKVKRWKSSAQEIKNIKMNCYDDYYMIFKFKRISSVVTMYTQRKGYPELKRKLSWILTNFCYVDKITINSTMTTSFSQNYGVLRSCKGKTHCAYKTMCLTAVKTEPKQRAEHKAWGCPSLFLCEEHYVECHPQAERPRVEKQFFKIPLAIIRRGEITQCFRE